MDVAQNRIRRNDILAVSNYRDMLPVCWLHSFVRLNVKNLQSWYPKHVVKIKQYNYRSRRALRVTGV